MDELDSFTFEHGIVVMAFVKRRAEITAWSGWLSAGR